MKNIVVVLGLTFAIASCGNSNGASDQNTNPSDTTGRNVNSAINDPNSNMADTMRMRDSSRVKDTSIRDQTATPKKH